jgi:hypothetical protein
MHKMVIKTEGVQVRILALGPNEAQHRKIRIRISQRELRVNSGWGTLFAAP